MTRNLDREIQQAKSRIGQLGAELRAKRELLRTLEAERVKAEYGVELGSVVIAGTQRFVVCEIGEISYGGKPWLYGHPFKKDGTPSANRRYLFSESWELERDPAP